uniref:Ubiquitin-associated protein 1 n=1 Tax=Paramormyrops kingsleyae TaxID=1676925 RepID=A0A3B3T9S0_9TELE|nr:ubiquitin-associated protein 1 [Paramormyrops kingsleyae]XP_023667384.1 ubiquitin-associated protein 1 [Paramormyrops kingsleyae]
MAAKKSASDIHNNGPISYLEDVPFKINDKFKCPAKVGFPIGFCLPDWTPLLSDIQYDFSLERRSVQWGADLALARSAQHKAQQCAEADDGKAGEEAQDVESGGPGDRNRPGPPEGLEPRPPPPPALNPVLAGLSHNAILTPLPAPSRNPARPPSPTPPPPHSLNLADFEREEDPFDKLELKTLDDKEELRSILQQQSASPPDPPEPPQAKSHLVHKPDGLVGLLELDRDTERPCNIRSLTFPKLSDPENTASTRKGLPNGTPLTLLHRGPQKDMPPSHMHNGATKQVEPQTAPAPAPTPPALPCVTEPPSGKVTPCGLLLSLSPSERACVETLVGMGYSYEGVLKAMQRQGQNVEQVLDYLFIHGRLCERGFDSSTVEECLEMYQCSEEKALEFLQLMTRFGEMGFERDTIKEVLLVHNNDQDKALEDLMARAAAS